MNQILGNVCAIEHKTPLAGNTRGNYNQACITLISMDSWSMHKFILLS